MKGDYLCEILSIRLGLYQYRFPAAECVSEHGKAACKELGGECITERDGYYILSAVCLGLGVISVIFHMIPTARKLQGERIPELV